MYRSFKSHIILTYDHYLKKFRNKARSDTQVRLYNIFPIIVYGSNTKSINLWRFAKDKAEKDFEDRR